jgi:hypothetical protein
MMTPDYMERPTVDILLSHPRLSKLMLRRRRSQYFNQMVGYQLFYIYEILTEPSDQLFHLHKVYIVAAFKSSGI